MMLLHRLLVTQDSLRKSCQIDMMVEHVRSDGFWTRDVLDAWAEANHIPRSSPLIQITEFEDDGRQYVHDGHHRLCATFLGGRFQLRDDEYELTRCPYAHYLEYNPEGGWFTPFDPRTEVRVADFSGYKQQALALHRQDRASGERFARENHGRYAVPRTVHTVRDLAGSLKVLV
jgi:hypothetical protein